MMILHADVKHGSLLDDNTRNEIFVIFLKKFFISDPFVIELYVYISERHKNYLSTRNNAKQKF